MAQLSDNQVVSALATVLRSATANLQAKPKYEQNAFTYVVPILAVANDASKTGSLNVPSTYDFQIESMVAVSSVSAGDLSAAPKGTVQINGGGSQSNWFSNATPISAAFGANANHPFILPIPLLIARGSVLVIDVTNGEGAQADFYFSFSGQQLNPIS